MTAQLVEGDLVHAIVPISAPGGTCEIYVAKDSGLYRSTDEGQTWTNVFELLGSGQEVPALALVHHEGSGNGSHIFAGIPGGIVASHDTGSTWLATQLGSPAPLVSSLAVSPAFAEDGVVLAGSREDGVYRSASRGQKWFPWNFGLVDTRVQCLHMSENYAADETVFVGTDSGLFVSENGARSWSEVVTPAGSAGVYSLSSHRDQTTERLYVATTVGLLASLDGGVSWAECGPRSVRQVIETVVAHPNSSLVSVVANGQLHLSDDAGATWRSPSWSADEWTDITAVAYPGSGDVLIAGTVNGQLRTTEIGKIT